MKSERKRTEHDDLVGTVQVGHRHSLTHSVELRFATPLEGIYPAAGTIIKPRTGVSIASESSGNDSNDSSPERERYTSTDGSRANNTADREQHDASTERTSVRRGKMRNRRGSKSDEGNSDGRPRRHPAPPLVRFAEAVPYFAYDSIFASLNERARYHDRPTASRCKIQRPQHSDGGCERSNDRSERGRSLSDARILIHLAGRNCAIGVRQSPPRPRPSEQQCANRVISPSAPFPHRPRTQCPRAMAPCRPAGRHGPLNRRRPTTGLH